MSPGVAEPEHQPGSSIESRDADAQVVTDLPAAAGTTGIGLETEAVQPTSPVINVRQPRLVSCERCKQRKAKCDRQRPACRRCEAAGLQCEYANRRKPGFPMGHRLALEAQIRDLQAEITKLKDQSQGQDQVHEPIQVRDQNQQDHEQTSGFQAKVGEGVSAANISVAVAAESPLSRENPQPPEHPPFPDYRIRAASFLRTESTKELKPPVELIVSRVPFYFRQIHPWLPCLNSHRVLADLAFVEEPTLLHMALFGVCLPHAQSLYFGSALSDSFWKYTKRRIIVEALEEPSYVSLEALTVLVLDLSGMTNGPQVWGALAVAIKLAMTLETTTGRNLRLSTMGNTRDSAEFADLSSARRLFWMIYALDCYVSLTTGFVSELPDSSLSHVMPLREGLWRGQATSPASQPWTPLTNSTRMTSDLVFSYQLELLDLSRRIHGLFIEYSQVLQGQSESLEPRWFKSFMGCSSGLNAWLRDLPETLQLVVRQSLPPGSSDAPLPAAVMLSVYYHALNIFLHGMVCLSHHNGIGIHSSQLDSFRSEGLESALRSVECLVGTVSTYTQSYADKLGWPFAWCVWTAARFLLAACHAGESVALDHVAKLLHSLDLLGRYWQISGHYARVLRLAQSELESLAVAAGTQPSGFLRAVVSWHVPTSDLEDQARVDPLLPESPKALFHHGQQSARSEQGGFPGSSVGAVEMERSWNALGQAPDSWMYMALMNPSGSGFPDQTGGHFMDTAPDST
ncbi:hypothetical protein ACHAQH_009731 [Verticillium albo-atrum]